MKYSGEWRKVVNRLGRWIDFDNDYKTMNPSFMESVWWAFKILYDRGLVYRGVKVMPYSTACTTCLSNFEANQNYKLVREESIYVAFELVPTKITVDMQVCKGVEVVMETGELSLEHTYVLAWTTTPWTLPSNLALAVNKDLDYVRFPDPKDSTRFFLMAKVRLCAVFPAKVVEGIEALGLPTVKGRELLGVRYHPLFPYFRKYEENCFRVLSGGFVTSDTGLAGSRFFFLSFFFCTFCLFGDLCCS
jgi:isoleucyl-tRNA synthetase